MKHAATIILATLLLSLSAEAQNGTPRQQTRTVKQDTQQPATSDSPTGETDLRTVGGVQVNLAPIHQWDTDKKGERPMKHWKWVTFETYLGVINGGHCFNVTVDGNKKTILLQNPPTAVLTLATRVRNLEIQLGRATFIAQRAEANKTVHEGRVSAGWYASGNAEWVNAVAQQEAQLQLNAANAKALAQLTDAQRRQLEQDFMSAQMDFHSRKELAMFTGRVIMQRELWDCGLRK